MSGQGLQPARVSWPSGYTACAAITLDLDAESSVLYSNPEAADYLDVMALQSYGVRAGMPRLLQVLERWDLRATVFVPGYTLERWPDVVRAIRDAGHELGHHGYLHESVHGVDEATEASYLTRTLEAFDRILGIQPSGYRAPKFHMNMRTPALLAQHGFSYDSSLQDADVPYWLATSASEEAPKIVEIPVQYALDDGTFYLYLPEMRPMTTVDSPRKALEIWSLELEAQAKEGGCFNLTLHPYLSGRPSRAENIDRLLERMRDMGSMWIATCSEIAAYAATQKLERRWYGERPAFGEAKRS